MRQFGVAREIKNPLLPGIWKKYPAIIPAKIAAKIAERIAEKIPSHGTGGNKAGN